MVQVTHDEWGQVSLKWRAIRDNLRNFFLSPLGGNAQFLATVARNGLV